ncbi:MAG: serine hydrolase [Caldilineaceae bacterium]|nr:serine hydrolase [Caldilineaceae bacterium]
MDDMIVPVEAAAFAHVDQVLRLAVTETAPALQLVVQHQGKVRFAQAYGWLDPEHCHRPTTLAARFDLASVTKLFVTAAFMRLCDQGLVTLDQSVAGVVAGFGGKRTIQPYEDPLQSGRLISATTVPAGTVVDADAVTFRHLLTHSAGLPAWRPLFQQPDAAAARAMVRNTFFAAPIGTQIIYSDIGLILLGMAVESVHGQPLAEAVTDLVLAPLGLQQTTYLPTAAEQDMAEVCDPTTVAPTEFCRWRNRRILAEVHDENAARLGGVAGHAGLFSTAGDVARFGQLFLRDGKLPSGKPFLQPVTVQEMRRQQIAFEETRRGLGFLLWSADPTASSHPFAPTAFGHTGFTGTSLWMDPARDLVVALLTNEVYRGRTNRGIAALRVAVHQAVVDAVDGGA